MLKTLPIFVVKYGQVVCRKSEYRWGLNILKLKIVKDMTEWIDYLRNTQLQIIKKRLKLNNTYGKTGGVTLVTNDTSAIANKYDNKGLVMEQKLFEDGKSYAMVYGNNANGKCVYSK